MTEHDHEFINAEEDQVYTAEFTTTCIACSEPIEPGDDIVYSSFDNAWVHAECD